MTKIKGVNMELKNIILLVVMIIAGMIMGIMFNIALGKKLFDTGAIAGGAVVGVAMYVLGGGFSV
jgi:hypothetical protein